MARPTRPVRILDAPDGLAHLALISTHADGYTAQLATVNGASFVPLERATIAKALRELADAVEADAEA